MSRIDPEKDFAGFVDQRLWLALRCSWEGRERVIGARQSMKFIGAIPDDIYAIEDLARHFDRAAAEIRCIAKVLRRKHGITADDEDPARARDGGGAEESTMTQEQLAEIEAWAKGPQGHYTQQDVADYAGAAMRVLPALIAHIRKLEVENTRLRVERLESDDCDTVLRALRVLEHQERGQVDLTIGMTRLMFELRLDAIAAVRAKIEAVGVGE